MLTLYCKSNPTNVDDRDIEEMIEYVIEHSHVMEIGASGNERTFHAFIERGNPIIFTACDVVNFIEESKFKDNPQMSINIHAYGSHPKFYNGAYNIIEFVPNLSPEHAFIKILLFPDHNN